MFEGNKNKFRKIGSSVVLSGAVLNSAIVSTGQVSAVKSLLYYMNQYWFLRYLVILICSVPFLTNPFQKVFCVPEQDAKKDSYRVPKNFYNSLIEYEGSGFLITGFLLESILDEESKMKLKKVLEEKKYLVDENGQINVQIVKVYDDGRLAFCLKGSDKAEIVTTKFSTTSADKIDELCNYIVNYELDDYDAENGHFFSPQGVPDERLKQCIGKTLTVHKSHITRVIAPEDYEKIKGLLSTVKPDENGYLTVCIEGVQDKDGALSITLRGDETNTVIHTRGLTGNKKMVKEFIDSVDNRSAFEKVFCVPEQDAKKDSYKVPENFYNSLIKYEGTEYIFDLDEFKNILSERSKADLEGVLREDDSLVNEDGKITVRLVGIGNEGRLVFKPWKYNLLVRTKFSTTDSSKIDALCDSIQEGELDVNDDLNYGEFEKVFFTVNNTKSKFGDNCDERLKQCVGKKVKMTAAEFRRSVYKTTAGYEDLVGKLNFANMDSNEALLNVLVVGTSPDCCALVLRVIGAVDNDEFVMEGQNLFVTYGLTNNSDLVNKFFKYFEKHSEKCNEKVEKAYMCDVDWSSVCGKNKN